MRRRARRVSGLALLTCTWLAQPALADTPCATAMSPRPMPIPLTKGQMAAARQAPALGSFNIVIDAGPGLAGNAAALAAFNRAADQWKAWIANPVTVTIVADLQDLGDASVIGSTSDVIMEAPYATIRDQVVAGADGDDGILASLPTAAQFVANFPPRFRFSGTVAATKASLKALGFGGLDGMLGVTDATVTFNSMFNFDYDNSDGVTVGAIDFETSAAHEIGHVLGFISNVDVVDFIPPQAVGVTTLDLFRFTDNSANDPGTAGEFTTFARSMTPDSEDIFDDIAFEGRMSTGAIRGDRRQASHWKDDVLTGTFIGIMDPTLADGVVELVSQPDLRALDAIGWDIALGGTITTTSTTSTSTPTSSTTSTSLAAAACPPVPAVGCHSGRELKSSVQLKDNDDDTKDRIQWKLSNGDATAIDEFMDPVGGAAVHHVCLYDGSGAAQPLLDAVVESGGTCSGKPCWKAAGTTGFTYRNKLATPQGITNEKLKAGATGKSQVEVNATGVLIAMPTLPLTTPVTVQLVITNGPTTSCWQTTFTAATKSDVAEFKAKGP